MQIENIATTLINDTAYQYEVAQSHHGEDVEVPVDINEKWKQKNETSGASQHIHPYLINYETRALTMRGFFRGHKSVDELKQCVMETIREAYDCGVVTDVNLLLNTLYHTFKVQAIQLAEAENFLEGREMSKKYGTSDDKFAYYNSKYYYASEEACELFRSCIEEFAKEEEIPDFECEEGFGSGINPNFSYNSLWSSYHKNLKIINTEVAPPRNFSFFYGKNYEKNSEIFFVNGISFDSAQKPEESEKKWDKGRFLTMYDYANYLLSGRISGQEDSRSPLRYLKNFRISSLERILLNY
ncbi:MAG: hypothetical protein J1E62_01915 [Lachnospiraceae bacterium]|nr:hypothetical protein [Lachnospiraceae bacterium]